MPGGAVGFCCGDDGRDEDIVAKHILTFTAIGLVLLRPLVIERTADADTRVVGLAGSGVDIGHELIAQVTHIEQQREVVVFPDAALVACLAGSVSAEDGREGAILQPSQHQLGVLVAYLQVSANVVSPVAEAHVGGCGGEIRLEGQRTEGAVGVAREADGIAMAAQSAPSVEDKGSTVSTVQAHVIVEDVVAPECLSKAVGIVAGEVLLPVKPPEIHALLLSLANDILEHGAIESRILQFPGHTSILAESCSSANLSIMVLIAGHTVGRVQVERHLQPLVVHPVEQALRVGYEAFVPRPSRPAVQMPVHIHNHHVDGNVVASYLVGQVQEVLL